MKAIEVFLSLVNNRIKIRRKARQLVGAHSTCPVVVNENITEPDYTGKSYYWTTPSGKTIVHHPNAYGWRTRYWHSTLRVEISPEWIMKEINNGS